MKNKLLLRTNLLLCAILIVGFISASVIIYRSNIGAFRNNVERIANLTSDGIYYQGLSYFTEPISISMAMADNSMLKRFLTIEPDVPDEEYIGRIQEYLITYKEQYGFASSFLVSAKTDQYYHFSGQHRLLSSDDPANNWYYDFLNRADEYSFDAGADKYEGEMYFIDCKIFDDAGQVMGVIGVGFQIDGLQELTRRYSEEYDIAALLIGAREASKISDREHAAMLSVFKYADEELLASVIAGTGTGRIAFWGDDERRDCYMVSQYVSQLQCYLIVENDMSMLREPFERQLIIGFSTAALIALSIILVFNKIISSYNQRLLERAVSQEVENRSEMLYILNRAAIILLTQSEEGFAEAMSDGVGHIASLSHIDRVSVSRNIVKPDGLYASQVYRWSREAGSAINPLAELNANSYDRHIPRWKDVLASGECINGPVRLMPEAEALKHFGCSSVLAIPVFSRGSFWGFVLFEDLKNEREYSETEVDILRSAGFMLANAIMRYEESSQIEYQNRLLYTVSQISVMLIQSESSGFDEILWRSMGVMAEAVGADRMYIWENYINDGELYCHQTYEWSEGAEPQQGKALIQGVSYKDVLPSWEKAFLQKRCINGIVRELSVSEYDLLTQQGIISLLVVPIYLKEQFWGFVGFDDCHSERVFSENEESILRSASELIASALIRDSMERDILHLETEADKIYYDPLTGIYNRRYLDEHMARIFQTLSRSGSFISVMMADIDNFKKYNDTYGHGEGDTCLITVAKTLQGSITRSDDFVARYGGEEFIVVLPNTDEAGAKLIANKMLKNIRACAIPHEKNDAASCVTISIGIVTGKVEYPDEVNDYIQRADEMLYQSKHDGRNRYSFTSLQSGTPRLTENPV